MLFLLRKQKERLNPFKRCIFFTDLLTNFQLSCQYKVLIREGVIFRKCWISLRQVWDLSNSSFTYSITPENSYWIIYTLGIKLLQHFKAAPHDRITKKMWNKNKHFSIISGNEIYKTVTLLQWTVMCKTISLCITASLCAGLNLKASLQKLCK